MCRNLAFAATVALLCAGPAFAADKTPKADVKAVLAPPPVSPKANAEMRSLAERGDPLSRATFWNEQFALDPQDGEAGVKLSAALRGLGQYEKAAETAKAVIQANPRNVEALIELARAGLSDGQGFYAIEPLRQVEAIAPRDWRAPSLLGVAYEQVGRDDEALAAYELALTLSPDNAQVLSNLAMFRAGQGKAAEAETLLRRAAARPDVTVQIRQNLAFVLGVQGKLADAETLLRQDLPPELASNNLAYLKAMSTAPASAGSRPRTWESMKNGG